MLSFNKSFKHHRFSYLYEKAYIRLFSSSSSSSELDSSMVTFIKHKQYQKAIDLFEQQSQFHSNISVNMAITACTRLKDYQRGLKIVKQLSPQTLNNNFIQNSLFHLYIQSNNFDNAHRIFSTIKNKSNWTYTMMFKGFVSNEMSEKVLDFVDTMTIQPDEYTLSIVFKACAQVNDERAKKIGNRLLNQMSDDFQKDLVLMNSAISMLMSFDDVARAEQLFESLKRKDIVSYGAMMKGYVENDMSEKALDLFERMTVDPNDVIYIIIFKACARLADERAKIVGNKLLDQVLNKINVDFKTLHSAIYMLMRFGNVKHAEHLFESIKTKTSVSYGVMMKGYAENNMREQVLDLFEQMRLIPDDAGYTTMFTTCAKLKNERAKKIGKQLLDHKLRNPLTDQIQLASMIHMLMRFGDVKGAEHLFGLIKEKDVVSYNTMIQGYLENDMNGKALDLFEQMSVDPSDVTYSIVFKACAQLADERAKIVGNKLLDQVLNKIDVDFNTLHSAIHMLMRFGNVKHAEHLFESIKTKTSVSYGVMMKGYAENDMFEKVLDLFEQIPLILDDAGYTTLFTTCAKLRNERAKKIGKQLLDHKLHNPLTDQIQFVSMIHMLMRFGDVKGAEHLFGLVKEKNVFSYSTMIQGYLENDMNGKALDLFEQMSVDPNDVTYSIVFKVCAQLADERAMKLGNKLLHRISNRPTATSALLSSALHMLMRFGDEKRAEHLFESIQNKNISTYTSMMKAYNLNRQPVQSLQLFQRIKEKDFALDDDIVFILPINACSQISILAICQSLVAQIPSHFYNKPRISNALIGMWGKAGSLKNAQEIYTTINNPDIVAHTSMINAFGLNGKGPEAVDLFQQIPHSIRNEISYICVLNSCSHAGLLNAAHAIFEQIHVKTKRITTTMIDCLSRLFLFDEAQKLLAHYEKSNPPYSPMYMAIMSGARNCRDAVVSEKIYNSMKAVFPDQKNALISGSILLANVYSSLGDDDQAAIVRADRRINYGGKAKPGLTWTEKDGEIVEFGAHDQSHPLRGEIRDEGVQILHELNQHGYRSDPSWITRPLDQDETIDSVLCGHSEKLAIAFHFIRGRRPSFIQITKNLRICGDCHRATKLIAKIRQCEIVLRDANRVHHFSKDGTCSCQDHF